MDLGVLVVEHSVLGSVDREHDSRSPDGAEDEHHGAPQTDLEDSDLIGNFAVARAIANISAEGAEVRGIGQAIDFDVGGLQDLLQESASLLLLSGRQVLLQEQFGVAFLKVLLFSKRSISAFCM